VSLRLTSPKGRVWKVDPRSGNWLTPGAWLVAETAPGAHVGTWHLHDTMLSGIDTGYVGAKDAIVWADEHWPVDVDRVEEHKDLSALCLEHLRPPNYSGGSWTLNPDALAEAIMAAGWKRA